MPFVNVAQTSQLPAGTMKPVTVEGKDILLVNVEGRYYAIAAKCTHARGDLSKGKLEGKMVTCPLHGSRFDVTTGKVAAGPKIGFFRIRTANEPTYEVRVSDKAISVSI